MKTCTLRKLESGEIICTVDERPKKGDYYYKYHKNKEYFIRRSLEDEYYENCDKIIASPINVGIGKELKLFVDNEEICPIESTYEFKECEYTELETSVIIKL